MMGRECDVVSVRMYTTFNSEPTRTVKKGVYRDGLSSFFTRGGDLNF